MTGGSNRQLTDALLLGPWLSLRGQKMGNLLVKPGGPAGAEELCETGKVKPVIDRRYTLNDVPEAIRSIEAGHARGEVVVTVS